MLIELFKHAWAVAMLQVSSGAHRKLPTAHQGPNSEFCPFHTCRFEELQNKQPFIPAISSVCSTLAVRCLTTLKTNAFETGITQNSTPAVSMCPRKKLAQVVSNVIVCKGLLS